MTGRRPGKNSAAKSAARKMQQTTGLAYRAARAATKSPRTISVSVCDLIGTHLGATDRNAFDLMATIGDGTELIIGDADDLATGPDQARAELVTAVAAGAQRIPVRLVVTDQDTARRLTTLHPQVTTQSGVTVSVEPRNPLTRNAQQPRPGAQSAPSLEQNRHGSPCSLP